MGPSPSSTSLSPPVVSLVGKPDCGKTTLLEKLLPELAGRGYRIGTIKHHVHEFEMDRPGKDTWRHKQAGAHTVALASPTGIGVITDTDHDQPVAELVSRYFGELDLVITEGYKRKGFPKIEVFRSTVHPSPLEGRDNTWIAMVSDVDDDGVLPRFDFNQVRELADFLEKRFLADHRPCRTSLVVNGKPIGLNRFVEGFLRGTILGMLTSLKGCGQPRTVRIEIRDHDESG